jgi:hypothetical protein
MFNKKYYLIVSIILALLIFNLLPFSGGDNLKYWHLSRSIRQGEYKSIWLYNTPLHRHYPPFFPLLLATVASYNYAKILIFFLFLTLLLAAGKLFQTLNLPNYTILFFAFSPLLLIYSHWVLSEIPFMLFSVLALLFYFRKQWGLMFLFGLCAYFTRSIGISLMVGLTIGYLTQRESKN